MAGSRYSNITGLSAVHEMIRLHVGYGKPFTKQDLFLPMACTPMSLPDGVSTGDLLEDMVKYNFIKVTSGERGNEYMLVRFDKKDKPIVGFNPYKK